MAIPIITRDLIIFDCDGVLLDSEIIIARAHAKAFKLGGWQITEQELLTRFVGIADREMYAILERERGAPLPPAYEDTFKAEVDRAYREELCAVEGVHDLLATISKPVCIASGSSPAKLKQGLTHVGLYQRFAPHIFSATMVAHGKPAPDLFLFAAQQMKTSPARCVVIEDSVAGVHAAKAAGMPVIGFCGAGHCQVGHAKVLAQEGAHCVAHTMPELAKVMAGI
jgi:HAD superfamily hydrolase (TIGR01509 family)